MTAVLDAGKKRENAPAMEPAVLSVLISRSRSQEAGPLSPSGAHGRGGGTARTYAGPTSVIDGGAQGTASIGTHIRILSPDRREGTKRRRDEMA